MPMILNSMCDRSSMKPATLGRSAAGTLAGEMAAARDLPMGRHDRQAMTSPEVANAFQRFVKDKQDLLALLQRMVEQDQRMLAEMRQAPSG